jgi:tetratricopeptide (TPR) repeat protein
MGLALQSEKKLTGPWGLLLALAVVVTYLPVLHAGFIWDDDGRITANPCVVGPLGLKEIWTTNAADICPLVVTTFWVEHALWGLAPLPYHLVNVLLHAACAILLWRVLLALQVPGAWLGAALWALHPVQVETAAWVTEMKNTQSGVFYLLTVHFYLRFLRANAPGHRSARNGIYACTLIFAALALLSKSSTVILPIVLGLCAWWVEGRWHWRNLARLAPIAVMAVFPALLTLWTQKLQYQGPASLQFARTFPERLATAGDAVWFYLGKLIWPHPLIFIYPRWQIDASSPVAYLPLLAVIALLLLLGHYRETWMRPHFFAFAYFVGALLPVLGLVDGYFWRYSLVGDHFLYLASMGPLALAGAGLFRFAHFIAPRQQALPAGLCAAPLLILGLISWQRSFVYQSIDTLWLDTLAQNPNCWMADNNYGLTFYDKGQLDEAVTYYQKALAINPHLAEPHNNLGNVFIKRKQIGASITAYETALDIDPYYSRAHNNLGNALFQTGRLDEAIAHYQRALEIDPTYVDADNDLGVALLQKGSTDEAIEADRKALALDPADTDAHNNLGNALYQKGAMDDAITEYQRALQIDPKNAKAHNGLGNAFNQNGRIDEAISEYRTALEIDPTYAEADNDLGVTLLQKGEGDAAIAQFEKALLLTPNDANAHYSLGYALLQKGRIEDAIAQFEIVVRLDPGNQSAQKNLARARALAHAPGGPK